MSLLWIVFLSASPTSPSCPGSSWKSSAPRHPSSSASTPSFAPRLRSWYEAASPSPCPTSLSSQIARERERKTSNYRAARSDSYMPIRIQVYRRLSKGERCKSVREGFRGDFFDCCGEKRSILLRLFSEFAQQFLCFFIFRETTRTGEIARKYFARSFTVTFVSK